MVAVLFARSDSIYKSISGCDVWDQQRDAMKFCGSGPVIAHPPCRSWGRLSHFSKHEPEEQKTGIFAVDVVRKNGGVLEHPQGSKLWESCGMSTDNQPDEFGGWTLPLNQCWFGHRAEKKTWLYIVGCRPVDIPAFGIDIREASHVINTRIRKGQPGHRPEVSKKEREATPFPFASWLIELAEKCKK